MSSFELKLNNLIQETFKDILKVEELVLKRTAPKLSVSEIQLLEEVSIANEPTVSDLAEAMDIAVPSATVAINKLVSKGYLTKERNAEDGRSIVVSLTREGEKINRLSHYIRMKLVKAAVTELDQDEKDALLKGVEVLEEFFKKRVLKYGGIGEAEKA